MEFALHLAEPQDLDRRAQLGSLEPSLSLRPTVELALQKVGEVDFTRVVWGTEFCENLLPGPEKLVEMQSAVAGAGLDFTLLTPYCGNEGLARIRLLLAAVQAPAEVVFNDWGVLNLLRREYPLLTPVQGRLMHKSLRDPRVMGQYGQAEPTTGLTPTLDALRNSSLQNTSYAKLLRRFGVERVELDALPQGTSYDTAGLAASLYFPFGFISTARVCQAAGLGYRKAEKFQPAAPCRHECQTHLLEYTYTDSPFANRDQKFFLKGNTYFFTHTPEMLDAVMASGPAVSRLIFQPRLPMLAAEAAPSRKNRQPLVQLQPV